MISCYKCGASFTRKFNLKRHQASRCKGRMLVNTVRNMNNSYQPKEGNVADALINKVIDDDDDKITNGSMMIHPYSRKEVSLPVNKISSVHEAAKKLNVIPSYDSEDERIISDDSDDETDFENKNFVEGRGQENYNGSENADDDESRKQLKPIQLRARLYTSANKMKVFELDLDVERALSNIDLLKYVRLLKIPNFRDVFHIDELPKRVNEKECGIVNLSPHEQLGTHWVSYVKDHSTRIYFDSFGRKTPLEIQKYMKTAKEFRNDAPVIQRNTDIVQRVNTKICGHLCLFVLTSLMRENFSFSQVMDQLNYAFDEYYY